MKKVLVAGATGYLGRYAVQEFHSRGYTVRALARNPQKLTVPGPFLEPAVDGLVNDIFVGEITRPETLQGLCDGIDVVFSSIGVTRQRDGVSFMEVDYQGNKNLLYLAVKAGVKKFIFVSVYNADRIEHLAQPRELFAADLKQAGIEYAIIRPTGYFSDMTAYLEMANNGRVYLIGDGRQQINPIHGADLAEACVAAVYSRRTDINVGGPETYSHTDIAALAFATLGRTAKITRVPVWPVKLIVNLIRPFSRHYYTLATFFMTVMQNKFVAPPSGKRLLRQYFEAFASQSMASPSKIKSVIDISDKRCTG